MRSSATRPTASTFSRLPGTARTSARLDEQPTRLLKRLVENLQPPFESPVENLKKPLGRLDENLVGPPKLLVEILKRPAEKLLWPIEKRPPP